MYTRCTQSDLYLTLTRRERHTQQLPKWRANAAFALATGESLFLIRCFINSPSKEVNDSGPYSWTSEDVELDTISRLDSDKDSVLPEEDVESSSSEVEFSLAGTSRAFAS